MKPVPAHITVDGTPLCQCGILSAKTNQTCGHLSLADAHRAKRVIQKHRHSVRVVRGHCPA